MITNIKTYYKDRAPEYDKSMYFRNEPGRIEDAKKIDTILIKLFKQKEIIEIACGTGYWTGIISKVAKTIKATDAVQEVLELAKSKKYLCPVDFEIADANKLYYKNNSFTGGVACFWFSHILRKDITKFLKEFHRVLKSDSMVFLCDNVLHEENAELIKKGKDTFRIRKVGDKKYKVIKNYYTKEELEEIFGPYASNSKINMMFGKWAWAVWYKNK